MLTVQQVESLHRSAQAQLGLTGAFLGADGFSGVDAVAGRGLSGWAKVAASQVLELRAVSHELAITAYQLSRWLQTGYSLGSPMGGAESGAELANHFFDLVQAVSELGSASSDIGRDVSRAMTRGESPVQLGLDGLRDAVLALRDSAVEDKPLKVDSFTWGSLDSDVTDQIESYLLKGMGEYSQRQKNKDGKVQASKAQSLAKQVAALKQIYEGDALQEKLAELNRGAMSRGAGLLDNLIMNAGRDTVLEASERDNRVMAYARGTSSNPCNFCAMLASRGFAYATDEVQRSSGSLATIVRSYHPNCHCYPIVRWVDADDESLPPENKFFMSMWPDVTAGVSGKEKQRVWRRWLASHMRRNGGVVNISDTQEGI